MAEGLAVRVCEAGTPETRVRCEKQPGAEDGRVAREGEQRVSAAQGRDGTLGAAGGIGILIVPKPVEVGWGDAAGPHLGVGQSLQPHPPRGLKGEWVGS